MSNLAQFDILTTDLLSVEDRKKIIADVINIQNPKQALPAEYTLKLLDHYGRVAVVMYRGVEVLLLFKRMTSKHSILHLEVGPKVYLKNLDEAWIAYKLMNLYPGVPLGERVLELEFALKQQKELGMMLQLQLEESDNLCASLLSKKRKKESKGQPKTVIPIPLASPLINKMLLKISPMKLQDVVRKYYLWSQGFDSDLVHVHTAAPEILPKYKKKVLRHITKLTKLFKKAHAEKNTEPYKVRLPKVRKKKVVKKVVKKKK